MKTWLHLFTPFCSDMNLFERVWQTCLNVYVGRATSATFGRSACGSNENTMHITKNEKRICKIISINSLVAFYMHYEQQKYN